MYSDLYLQIVSTMQCFLLKEGIKFHKSSQNVGPFYRHLEILFLDLSMESGQRRMRDNSFLFLVPILLPVKSFISVLPKMQSWNGV